MIKSTIPSRHSRGKFISHNIKLELHEIETINFLLNLGEDIEQIPPSNTPHNKQPDIFMRHLAWEMKCPISNSAKAFTRLFYKSLRQSPNIIFDLRHLNMHGTRIITLAKKLYLESRKAKKMLIITRESELLEFHKNS